MLNEQNLYVSKYFNNGVYTLGKDYAEYDDPKDFIKFEILKFCGCGCPNDTLVIVLKMLTVIENKKELKYEDFMKQWNNEIGGKENVDYFIWYYLSELELTEHGSCVPGWLSELGKGIKNDLEIILKDEE